MRRIDGIQTMPNASVSVTELFFALIRCSIGKQEKLPRTPNGQEWSTLLEIAEKQAVTGITFAGIEKLPREQQPPKRILLAWHNACELIKKRNIDLDKRCTILSDKFKELGFKNCIIKGQGVAQLYPNPTLRTPGDIDIWLDGGCDRILEYIKKGFPCCKPTYHHVDFPISKEAKIEVHFTPSWMYNPFLNKRLQRFFKENADAQFANRLNTAQGSFPAPTTAFNRIYILLHIYRHLFLEGIGLRQLLDCYFVLDKGTTPDEKEECTRMLKQLGLKGITSATMYVLTEIFWLEREKLLVEPKSKNGRFLLKEIMIAGNFGKYDNRYKIVAKENEMKHFLNSMRRISRLLLQYPAETLWSPYFKVWHYFWRKRH